MTILFLVLLILIVLIVSLYLTKHEAAGELVQNKKLLKGSQKLLGYAGFSTLVEKKNFNTRLVCVVGADCSGRSHLAKMISKKGFTLINTEKMKPPEIRREFSIGSVSPTATAGEKAKFKAQVEVARKKKYVIDGKFSDDDLHRIFKGKGYDRNFILIFVQPKPDCAARWSKLTGRPKEEYSEVLKESETYLKSLKDYRLYIIKNNFQD